MSGFSKANLKEPMTWAPSAACRLTSRAGFGRKHLDSRELGVSYFRYGPGFQSPTGHHHREQEEAYVVVGGSGRIKLDDEILDLVQWDVVRVAPEVVRAFEGGPEGLELIAVGGAKPEGGDGVPVQDFWNS